MYVLYVLLYSRSIMIAVRTGTGFAFSTLSRITHFNGPLCPNLYTIKYVCVWWVYLSRQWSSQSYIVRFDEDVTPDLMLNRIPKTLSLSEYRLRSNAFSAAMGQIVKCRFYYNWVCICVIFSNSVCHSEKQTIKIILSLRV